MTLAFLHSDNYPQESALSTAAVFLLLVVVSTATAVLYASTWRPKHVQIPGPPRVPGFGILFHIIQHWKEWPTECVHRSQLYNHETWGGPCLKYGALLCTDDPANVKHILKDNFGNYEKGEIWRSTFHELLGNGIFSADGATWEAHRKISSRLFSRNLLKFSCQVMHTNCQLIVDQLLANMSGNRRVDIQDLFFRLMIDSAAATTFGYRLNGLESGQQPPFADAFDEMQLLCLDRIIDPLFQVKRFFRLGHRENRIRYLKKVLDNFCKTVIQEKRHAVLNKEEGHEDLVSLFLKYSKHSEEYLADEELRDVILNMLVAGRDTTAAALAWTFFELTKRPDVVDKIVAEVSDVCGPVGRANYSFEAISKLAYTHCVAMEVLRLHPSVPFDSKFAIRQDTLPDGTVIPAGCWISYLPLAMGRSELIWGHDAAEFKPERFMNCAEPSAYKFITFNAGPRLCLGKPLALLTMKVVMSHLLPRFHFEDVLGHSGEMEWLMVGKMKHGFVVEVSERKGECKK